MKHVQSKAKGKPSRSSKPVAKPLQAGSAGPDDDRDARILRLTRALRGLLFLAEGSSPKDTDGIVHHGCASQNDKNCNVNKALARARKILDKERSRA